MIRDFLSRTYRQAYNSRLYDIVIGRSKDKAMEHTTEVSLFLCAGTGIYGAINGVWLIPVFCGAAHGVSRFANALAAKSHQDLYGY